MNSKIFLIYYFKIGDNKRKKYNRNKKEIKSNSDDIIAVKNINQSLFKWKRYIINIFNDKFPFLLFGIMWFIGNKGGRYITQKYIFKKPEAKLFVISDLF